MFRVLERVTGLMVVAPPERSVRPRRPAIAADGRVAIPIEPASSAMPAMRAPWGEPAQPFPWVVVSTRVWTDVWPRVAGAVTATARAVERPASVVARAVERPASVVAPSLVPLLTRASAEPVLDVDDERRAPAARTVRPRRGLIARVAILAIGLLVSLIAIEAAARANRR